MVTGDKRQAIVLGAVAAGALAFMGSRLFSKKTMAAVAQTLNQGVRRAATVQPASLPTDLTVDSFSSEKLKPTVKPDEAAAATPVANSGSAKSRPLPMVGNGYGPLEVEPPDENAGNDQQVNQDDSAPAEAGPKICVTGVVTVNEQTALIEVEGMRARAWHPGEILTQNLRLVAVAEDGCLISYRGKRHLVPLGRQVQL